MAPEGYALHAEEEALFGAWRASLPPYQQDSFVTDGAVRADDYLRSSPKTLFLLKEVNDIGGGGWCLREFLCRGGRRQTWNIATRWLRAIRSLPEELAWSEIEDVTEDQRCEELSSVAAMNLKKIPGGHTAVMDDWWRTVERDREYIYQQLNIYRADLIICCGSSVSDAFDTYLKPVGAGDWKWTSRGVEFLEYDVRKFVIAYAHPEARVAPNVLHYGLIDAVREIFYGAHSDKMA